MPELKFDFNNMFSFNVGKAHGVTETELAKIGRQARKAYEHLQHLADDRRSRLDLNLEWVRLPFQDAASIERIQELGDEIGSAYENVISLGIGGSYLGLKAAQDALRAPYYNEFSGLRKGRPRIYFEGNNFDPETLCALMDNLDPKKTFVMVISKSGETTETKAALAVVESWLKDGAGDRYGRQILAITDPESGSLRAKAESEHARDPLSFRTLPLLRGVGGRFSELNMGLLHLAIIGVDLRELLSGARDMAERCTCHDPAKNPALIYAALQTILYRKKGKSISVLMPFSEALKSTADWYCQLLAESIGKKYGRKVTVNKDGAEVWAADKTKAVNVGRTPVACRGTNDLHSIHQNDVEGENNKTTTFIRVDKFKDDIKVAGTGDFLSRNLYSHLINTAQEATEWALVRESRPNCTIVMPEVSPLHWGELVFFFEMATAFEGELLNINAFDQPGVETYKQYMYHKLGKPGLPAEIAERIRKTPLVKRKKFIL